jgi:hypothetical protein
MSWLGNLLGTGKQTTTATQGVPGWVEDAGRRNLITAEQIAAGAYPENIGRPIQYTGPRVAGLTPDEMQARASARNVAGNPFLDEAAGMVRGAAGVDSGGRGVALASGQRFKDSDTTAFMNPYMDAVFGEIERTGDRNLNDIRARAAKAGAFGGSRQAVAESLQRDQTQRQVGQVASQAFESGQQQFNTEQNRGLQIAQLLDQITNAGANRDLASGQALANLGQAGFGNEMAIIQMLNQLGGQERGIAQGIFDTQYGDFREARDYPMRMQQYIQSVLAGTPFERTTTTTAPGASLMSQVIGAGATGVGIAGPRGLGWLGPGGTGVPGFRN